MQKRYFLMATVGVLLLVAASATYLYVGHLSKTAANKELLTGVVQPDAKPPCIGENRYNLSNGKIYYQFGGNCNLVANDPNIPDIPTFQALDYGFARDKFRGYYQGHPVEAKKNGYPTLTSDGSTFQALAEAYAKDKEYVYFLSGYTVFQNVVDGADPATFQVLAPSFGKDAHSGYYGWASIPQSEGQTFAFVDAGGFSKDAHRVYLKDKIIESADPNTFQVNHMIESVSGQPFSMDAAHVFWGAGVIADADPDSFMIADITANGSCPPYFKDKAHVFAGQEVMQGVDPTSFRLVGLLEDGLYSGTCVTADANHVYVGGVLATDLDVGSVRAVGNYLIDVHGVYFQGRKKLVGADPKTFAISDGDRNSAKDQYAFYQCGQAVVPNRDSTILLGDFYGKFGGKIYYQGKLLLGADAATFAVMGSVSVLNCEKTFGGYAKDANHVYFSGRVIAGADPKTFRTSYEIGVAFDKNEEYHDGVKIPNQFVHCSTNSTELPGGVDAWKKLFPQAFVDQVTSFEFCTMSDKSILMGYKPDPNVEVKNYQWFDSNGKPLGATSLDCGKDYSSVMPQSINSLNNSTVKLTCLGGEACTERLFYELDLDVLKRQPGVLPGKTKESYDCGYRG